MASSSESRISPTRGRANGSANRQRLRTSSRHGRRPRVAGATGSKELLRGEPSTLSMICCTDVRSLCGGVAPSSSMMRIPRAHTSASGVGFAGSCNASGDRYRAHSGPKASLHSPPAPGPALLRALATPASTMRMTKAPWQSSPTRIQREARLPWHTPVRWRVTNS